MTASQPSSPQAVPPAAQPAQEILCNATLASSRNWGAIGSVILLLLSGLMQGFAMFFLVFLPMTLFCQQNTEIMKQTTEMNLQIIELLKSQVGHPAPIGSPPSSGAKAGDI